MHKGSFLYLALGTFAGLLWQVHPSVDGAKSQEVAEIFPASTISIGDSLNLSYGYGLFANGITDNWASTSTSLTFVALVFTAQKSVTQAMTFTVTSPTGAVVSSYKFSPSKIGYEGTWYTVNATGKYSTPGIYHAAMYADGVKIGEVPVVITH